MNRAWMIGISMVCLAVSAQAQPRRNRQQIESHYAYHDSTQADAAFWKALLANDPVATAYFLNKRANPNLTGPAPQDAKRWGDTLSALALTIVYGRHELMRILLNQPGITVKPAKAPAPLLIAAWRRDEAAFQTLLAAGAELQPQAGSLLTAAVEMNDTAWFQYIFKTIQKARPGYVLPDSVVFAAVGKCNPDFFILYQRLGVDLSACRQGADNLLFAAVRTGHLPCFRYLLAEGVSADVAGSYGMHLLTYTLWVNQLEIFQWLVKAQHQTISETYTPGVQLPPEVPAALRGLRQWTLMDMAKALNRPGFVAFLRECGVRE